MGSGSALCGGFETSCSVGYHSESEAGSKWLHCFTFMAYIHSFLSCLAFLLEALYCNHLASTSSGFSRGVFSTVSLAFTVEMDGASTLADCPLRESGGVVADTTTLGLGLAGSSYLVAVIDFWEVVGALSTAAFAFADF